MEAMDQVRRKLGYDSSYRTQGTDAAFCRIQVAFADQMVSQDSSYYCWLEFALYLPILTKFDKVMTWFDLVLF